MIAGARTSVYEGEMPTEVIDSLDDPRLEPYRNLKSTNRTRWSNQFIAEGMLVVERLLASDFEVVSVLASRKMERHIVPLVPDDRPLYLLDHVLAAQLVGYTFHTGVLACGVRKPGPMLETLIVPGTDSTLLAACPNVSDPENIGALIRLCAGFGLSGLVLGPGCADPFSRRVLRVSMGTTFSVPIVEARDLRSDLIRLRDEFAVELCAAVLDPRAERLESVSRSARMALLFGNERHGLDPQWIELCQRRLTIPMAPGADSLNVAVAAGIFFHHLQHSGRPPRSEDVRREI
jgi:tRNA G18 (ribose-2'-O)-methylase SpoU